jgi:hypothetical protein
MLELDVTMESEDVAHYLAHAKLAEEIGLPELKMKLEAWISELMALSFVHSPVRAVKVLA